MRHLPSPCHRAPVEQPIYNEEKYTFSVLGSHLWINSLSSITLCQFKVAVTIIAYLHGTLFSVGRTPSNNLHNPNFSQGIGDRNRFTLWRVTVSVHELCHGLDGLTCCFGALQGQIDKRSIIDDCPWLVCQCLDAPKCWFTNNKSFFVAVADDFVTS